MCDVHLIETSRRRLQHWRGPCSFCQGRVDGPAELVVGHLDDGSPDMLEFHYHTDCLDGIEYEGVDDNDGCFSYGTPSVASAA